MALSWQLWAALGVQAQRRGRRRGHAFSGPGSRAGAIASLGSALSTDLAFHRPGDRESGLRPHARTTGPSRAVALRPERLTATRSAVVAPAGAGPIRGRQGLGALPAVLTRPRSHPSVVPRELASENVGAAAVLLPQPLARARNHNPRRPSPRRAHASAIAQNRMCVDAFRLAREPRQSSIRYLVKGRSHFSKKRGQPMRSTQSERRSHERASSL